MTPAATFRYFIFCVIASIAFVPFFGAIAWTLILCVLVLQFMRKKITDVIDIFYFMMIPSAVMISKLLISMA